MAKVPNLVNELRVELAVEIAEALTNVTAEHRGITVWQVDSEGSESYTEEAQDIFNHFYDQAEGIVNEVFGIPKK